MALPLTEETDDQDNATNDGGKNDPVGFVPTGDGPSHQRCKHDPAHASRSKIPSTAISSVKHRAMLALPVREAQKNSISAIAVSPLFYRKDLNHVLDDVLRLVRLSLLRAGKRAMGTYNATVIDQCENAPLACVCGSRDI